MADNTDFTHLHSHGEYSMLDGVGTIEHVVAVAKKRGFHALAQTDHGNVSGALKFAKECQNTKDKDGNPVSPIKPIVGCEIYIVDDVSWRKPAGVKEKEERYHTIVLAKNWDGFVSLMRLLTKAHSEKGFYYKPRVHWNDVYELTNCVVTTACVTGPFKHPDWQTKIKEYKEAFGEDFYLEVQPHNIPEQYELNRKAVEMSLYTGAKLVASNDFHYANHYDCHAQEALLAIRNQQTQSSDDKWDFTPGLYMRNLQEMMEAFNVLEGGTNGSVLTADLARHALLNTKEIVEKCNFVVPKFDVALPDVNTSELGTDDPDMALLELCTKGWKKRFQFAYGSSAGGVYEARLSKELELIFRLKFSKYFLLVWDLYRFCNKNGIAYGPGRGSGAGSLVCYLTGITNADPIHYGLIFERFINPERIDLPDLDLDFEHERRDEIYRYMQDTYKHVAHIATYGGMNAKMVLKDVSRFKEIPLAEVETVCREIDFATAKQDKANLTLKKIEEAPDKYPEFMQFKNKNFAAVEIAKVLEGQVRQSGVHAGGVIVSATDLTERCAVEWNKGDAKINFDMYDIGDLNLLKVDVLGSKTVSVLKYTKELIEKELGDKELILDNIPLDDKHTLAEFDKGNTTGIFQFESDGIRRLLQQMAPHDINTIITANAMYRPGPLQFSGTYIKNKANPKIIKPTGNDALDRITSETFGVFIYQEQVMRIAVEVAGYTYPEADALRKKISKSKGKAEVEKDRPKFVEGCVNFGKLSKETSERIFDEIVDFGRYAFNKSHATTYSLISFYAMWLRTHFPCEFLTASIAYAGDTSNASEHRKQLKAEATRLGIYYAPPHINYSHNICSIEKDENGKKRLRGGFNEVDGIGNAATDVILRARGNEPFTSFKNFLDRLENKKVINVGVQEKLLRANLFTGLHTPQEIQQIIINLRAKPVKVAKVKAAKVEETEIQQDLIWLLTASPQ